MNKEDQKDSLGSNIIIKVSSANEWQKSAANNNLILHGSGFYISFNAQPANVESQETALIDTRARMSRPMYILPGDHRDAYETLVEKGFDDCFNYYQSQLTK